MLVKKNKLLLITYALVIVAIVLAVIKWFYLESSPTTPSLSSVETKLPPDPGEAGKATLAGIDSDGDGLRDDIQRYISFTYPQSRKTRMSLTQYAKAIQSFLLQSNTEQGAIAAARVLNAAQDCTFYVLGVSIQSINVRRDLRAEILNTPARSRAYIRADGYLGGISAPGTPDDQKKALCSFNPDNMEN